MSLSSLDIAEEPPGTVNNPPVGGPATHRSPHDMNRPDFVPEYGILPPVVPQNTDTDAFEDEPPLFPGHGPMDRSVEGRTDDQAVEPDRPTDPRPRGRKPYATDPWEAIDVFQRASTDFTSGAVVLAGSGVSWGSQTVQIGMRQRGRQSIRLWVPSSYPNVSAIVGVAFGNSEAEIQGDAVQPAILNEGDSISINAEAPVWVGLITGQTIGLVLWEIEYNPVGGQLGNL